MNKNIVITLVLTICAITWFFCISKYLQNSFYNIADWGGYIFIVPLVFSFYKIISKDRTNNNMILCSIMFGSLLSIFLATNFEYSFYLHKTLVVLLSSLMVLGVINTRNHVKKNK